MALSCGIVGLPNVGKSTLFNALTAAGAECANYPFCTIEPNHGRVHLPDERLNKLNEIYKPKSLVPATLEVVDIAGLVRGAHEGEGLGNQFLSHIRTCNAILHIVRCFDDPDIAHVEGKIDTKRDVEIIETELILADLSTVEKRLDKASKQSKTDKALRAESDILKEILKHLNDGKPAHLFKVPDEGSNLVRELCLLSAKPVLFIGNVDDKSILDLNNHKSDLLEVAKERNSSCLFLSVKIEEEVKMMPAEEQSDFLSLYGLSEPGLNRVVREAYSLLGLQTFFTAGEKEVRAWTIRKGAKAPVAAGVIHSDFERGFIKAEIFSFDDLIELGSEQAIKEKGRLRIEGRDYIIRDNDIIHFRFNV